jgi:hypothetical protein
MELIGLALKNNPEDEKKSIFKEGEKYFIRTVTYHLVGMVKEVRDNFILFDKMVWVADSGRFKQAIEEGELDEVEPCNVKGGVSIESIVDFFEWKHDIPTEQK